MGQLSLINQILQNEVPLPRTEFPSAKGKIHQHVALKVDNFFKCAFLLSPLAVVNCTVRKFVTTEQLCSPCERLSGKGSVGKHSKVFHLLHLPWPHIGCSSSWIRGCTCVQTFLGRKKQGEEMPWGGRDAFTLFASLDLVQHLILLVSADQRHLLASHIQPRAR